jgi:hypothetical protein
MKILPLKTLRRRLYEAREVRALITQTTEHQLQVERFAFVSKESKAEGATAKKLLRATLRDLKATLASNEAGTLTNVSRASFLKSTEYAKELIARERALLDLIRSSEELIESLLQQAGAIPLDQARDLQTQLTTVRDDFRRVQRKNSTRSHFLEKVRFIKKSEQSLLELAVLIEESAAAASRAEEILQLPLRTSREIHRKREMLTNYTVEVQMAREKGDAHVLRESWRQFKYLTDELKHESEASVARAVREIEMWLSYSELTPILTAKFEDRLMMLLRKQTSPNFLEDWATLKQSAGESAIRGFEAHWQEITGKFRKISDREKLSWQQLETAAHQIRKQVMPHLYRPEKNQIKTTDRRWHKLGSYRLRDRPTP